MKRCFYITGTDTDVGKTFVSTLILRKLAQYQIISAGYKPVASGGIETTGGMKNPDALALQKASGIELTYQEVNPYFFKVATAPHLLSQQENRAIEFSVMTKGVENLLTKVERVLIEGAGGWYTPLSHKTTFADWVKENHFPIIIVVGLKLGCINHALLTFESLKNTGVPILGWIGNHIGQDTDHYKNSYLESIKQLTDIPCLAEIPYLADGESFNSTRLDLVLQKIMKI